MRALVIPSNRGDCLQDFFAAWGDRGGWDQVVVVEDNAERTFRVPAGALHFSWREIDDLLGEDAWIFSRRDSAILCFGLLVAWHLGAEHVLTLSDDCFPGSRQKLAPTFFDAHLDALAGHSRWVSSVPGLRVRGIPYQNTGTLPNVVANVGLWEGHPDLDAISTFQTIAERAYPRYGLPCSNWIVPHGQYVPVCEMNLFISRQGLPLFYFPKQGEGSPYHRFDDIWAGVLAKRLCDHLGWRLSVGVPFVHHQRASDPFTNLVKEAPGIKLNETFWETVEGVRLSTESWGWSIKQMGHGLQESGDSYLAQLGKALHVWHHLLHSPKLPPTLGAACLAVKL